MPVDPLRRPVQTMKTLITAAMLALALGLVNNAPAQQADVQPIDSIVAVVEEDVILRSELDRAVQNIIIQFGGRTELPPREILEKQVLERLVLLRLQIQRAEIGGIRISEGELDQAIGQLAQQNNMTIEQLREQLERDGIPYPEFRSSLRDELVVQRLRTRLVQSRVSISDTEIDIALESGGAGSTQEVRIGHLLVALPADPTPEAVEQGQRKIEGVKGLIDRGEMDFSAAAIRYSDAPNALEGGVIDWRRVDEVPTLFAGVIQSLSVGEVSPPMRGGSGFHLLKVLERRDAGPKTATEYRARQILVRSSELLSEEEARRKIERIDERIRAGESFEEVAREESDDTLTRGSGGDLGWFQSYDYGGAIGERVQQLANGAVSEPFKSDAGWHLLQRVDAREVDVTRDTRRAQARETIARRKAEEEYERFLREIRSEAYIDTRLQS
ncbi:MAG TPA: peptidylprolyl isomerase [Xanthomonadaceae bacterium]|nr:peptidylprolyl isomerase [Xanthomonadaceae bacterium]